jgi:hypothetical protein
MVGFLLLYGLSIFWTPPQRHSPGPLIKNLDPEEFTDEPRSRIAPLSSMMQPRGMSGLSSSFQEMDDGSGKNITLTEKAKELMNRGERISLSNEQRKNAVAEELTRLGFNDRELINLHTKACDDSDYRRAKIDIKRLLNMKNYRDALELLQETIDNTADDNYLLRSEMLQQAVEIALMSGNLAEFERYTKEYFKTTEQVLAVYKNSKLNNSHESREKIYQLSRELESAKSGRFFQFLQSIQKNHISPREIIIAAKTNAAQNRSNSPFTISNQDIEKAVSSGEGLFQEWTNQGLR